MCPTFWGWLTSRSGSCGDNYRFALFRTADVEKPDVACEPRHPKNTLGLAIGDVQKREYRIRGQFPSPGANSGKISGRSPSEISIIFAVGAFEIGSLSVPSRHSSTQCMDMQLAPYETSLSRKSGTRRPNDSQTPIVEWLVPGHVV